MQSQHDKCSATKRLPSFQISKDKCHRIVFKLSKSCSYAGVNGVLGAHEKHQQNPETKKTQLNTVLEAIWSRPRKEIYPDPVIKNSLRHPIAKLRIMNTNKSFVN